MDYELEVAAVVGMGGADLDPDEAQQIIAGYCVMNDWSARDIQRREMKLSMGPVKGKDFATSLGPVFVTPDELEDARRDKSFDLAMTASVNGVEYSRASLADIYWSFGEMLAYASRGTRVETGDMIGSGTCGTGCILELSLVHGVERYPWLQPGDVVELSVERLGTLRNRVVAGVRVAAAAMSTTDDYLARLDCRRGAASPRLLPLSRHPERSPVRIPRAASGGIAARSGRTSPSSSRTGSLQAGPVLAGSAVR